MKKFFAKLSDKIIENSNPIALGVITAFSTFAIITTATMTANVVDYVNFLNGVNQYFDASENLDKTFNKSVIETELAD